MVIVWGRELMITWLDSKRIKILWVEGRLKGPGIILMWRKNHRLMGLETMLLCVCVFRIWAWDWGIHQICETRWGRVLRCSYVWVWMFACVNFMYVYRWSHGPWTQASWRRQRLIHSQRPYVVEYIILLEVGGGVTATRALLNNLFARRGLVCGVRIVFWQWWFGCHSGNGSACPLHGSVFCAYWWCPNSWTITTPDQLTSIICWLILLKSVLDLKKEIAATPHYLILDYWLEEVRVSNPS